jgi:hypothetical protein
MARRSPAALLHARKRRRSEPNACVMNRMDLSEVGLALPRANAQRPQRGGFCGLAIPRERWLDSGYRPRMKGQDLLNELGQD